jgi:[acyl-carrier-protein] S-malonyltransferase
VVLAVLAPGQGSQKPGFLIPWLQEWEGAGHASSLLQWYSNVTGLDLIHLGTEADAAEIRDTARTQPLLVAAGLLVASYLPIDDAGVVAGHSIGEVTGAALTGVLAPEAALSFAAARGREMAAACALEPTGMSAVLGGVEDEVLARLDDLDLTPANRNGAGQIVAAGSVDALAKLAADPPTRAKIITLQVAGAFHTRYMAPARAALTSISGGISPDTPDRMLLSNADGTTVLTGAEALRRLVDQVIAPVRWDLCQTTLSDIGVTAAIELAPAGTLAGLAKRTLKGIELVTVNTPDDLPKARDLMSRHAVDTEAAGDGASGSGSIPAFRVAVAPASGHFRPADLAEGATVPPGSAVGEVHTRQGVIPVPAPRGGVLTEWLAHHDDPVAAGQPLARLATGSPA